MNRSILFVVGLLLSACIGPNPNPREGEIAALRYADPQELIVLQTSADQDEAWAQLRLGVAYELGADVDQNIPTAVQWYKKAAAHVLEKTGADGLLVEGLDKTDYYSQHGDSLIALHQLANIYLKGEGVEKNLILAYLIEKYVEKETDGNKIFYCCMSSGGYYISAQAIYETVTHIEAEMTEQQRQEAKARAATWSIKEAL